VANVGIILLTTIGAVTLFHEKLSPLNWLGIGFALGAIALISFG
jgi:drug/metabolite transporter (DMT)-like permease